MRGFIIIGEAIERLKWKVFFEQYIKNKNYDFSETQRLMLEINNKSNENCVSIVDNCIKNIKSIRTILISSLVFAVKILKFANIGKDF